MSALKIRVPVTRTLNVTTLTVRTDALANRDSPGMEQFVKVRGIDDQRFLC